MSDDTTTVSPGKKKADPKIDSSLIETPFVCNCGNSDVGYQVMTFEEVMAAIEHAYIVRRNENNKLDVTSLKQENRLLELCGGNNFKDLTFFAYANNSKATQPHDHIQFYPFTKEITDQKSNESYCSNKEHLLLRNDFVIYGFTKCSSIFNSKDFNYFPILSPSINSEFDKYALKLKASSNVPDGTEFHAFNNPALSFVSPDGSTPYFNFILAYNNVDIYLLANTFPNKFKRVLLAGL